MQTKLVLKPGQNGTKKWTEIYGSKLVSVRYRYDEEKRKRYKTVEIIVEETPWVPTMAPPQVNRRLTDRFGIEVAPYKLAIREQIKRAGGIWRPRQKLWELSYEQITVLGLENRIVATSNQQK